MLEGLLRLLFPDRCLFCGEVCPQGKTACPHCLDSLPRREGPPLSGARLSPVEWANAPFFYEGLVRQGIHRFKFQKRTDASAFFAREMASLLASSFQGFPFDLVTWVPSSPQRMKERGFNPAQLLGEELCRLLSLEGKGDLLVHHDHQAQHTLGRRQRSANALLSFGPGPGLAAAEGRRLLLVDDVITTGSTLRACGQALGKGNPLSLYAVAAALVPPSR